MNVDTISTSFRTASLIQHCYFFAFRETGRDIAEIKFVMQTLPHKRLRRNVIRSKLDLVGKSIKIFSLLSTYSFRNFQSRDTITTVKANPLLHV
jgi:hypothetical protein